MRKTRIEREIKSKWENLCDKHPAAAVGIAVADVAACVLVPGFVFAQAAVIFAPDVLRGALKITSAVTTTAARALGAFDD